MLRLLLHRIAHFFWQQCQEECEEKNCTNQCSFIKPIPQLEPALFPLLDAETYHDARTVAPGYDIHRLETEWRTFWVESGKPELKNPDGAFIGFCKSRYMRNPNP
jgi:hypothetical protein